MSFDDEEVTGIATLESGELKIETGDLYDLSGRKVNNPTKKGIYLMNGKKVIK
jgi:arabinan endo-1,5-alpha-L-arabinosidase